MTPKLGLKKKKYPGESQECCNLQDHVPSLQLSPSHQCESGITPKKLRELHCQERGSGSSRSKPCDARGIPMLGTQKNAGLGPTTRNKRPVASSGALHPFPTSAGRHAPPRQRWQNTALMLFMSVKLLLLGWECFCWKQRLGRADRQTQRSCSG